MEKELNREEKIFIRLLNERDIEKPSIDFKDSVMMRIEANKASIKPYKPLIPTPVLIFLAIAFVLIIGGLYFQFFGISNNFSRFFEIGILEFSNISFPVINLSRITQYGFAFMVLFFLQIPFLKMLLNRQYESKLGL